jgi:hypothetical protein
MPHVREDAMSAASEQIALLQRQIDDIGNVLRANASPGSPMTNESRRRLMVEREELRRQIYSLARRDGQNSQD